MSYRKKISLLMILVFFWAVVGYFFAEIVRLKSFDNLDIYFGIPLFLFSLVFIILLFFFLFTKEIVFNSWKKFAKIFISIAMILIIITPTQYGGIVGIDKESATWSLASLFLLASLTIIIWKSIELKRKK